LGGEGIGERGEGRGKEGEEGGGGRGELKYRIPGDAPVRLV